MTWVFFAVFVGLAVAVAVGVRRDIRKAAERRRARELRRQLEGIREAMRPMTEAFAQLQAAAVTAGAAFQKVGEAMREANPGAAQATGRSPFPRHPKQKGSTG